MAWWLWIILMAALVGTIALSFWFFASVWKSQEKERKANRAERKKNKIKSVDELQERKYITFDQIKDIPNYKMVGVYSIYVGPEIDEKDFFIPIYVTSSLDIVKSIKNDEKKILKATDTETGDVYQTIIEYLKDKNKKLNDIRFSILETLENSDQLKTRVEYWMKETKAKQRGFNK